MKNKNGDERLQKLKMLKAMVERTVGATTVPCLAVISSSRVLLSCSPGGRKSCCAALPALDVSRYALAEMPCYFLPHLLRLRITVQSLHSIKGPPATRLSAPCGLPCAFAAFPHLRASVSARFDSSARIALCCQSPPLLLHAFGVSVSLLSATPSFRSRAVTSLCWLLLTVRFCCFLALCRSLLRLRLLHFSLCCVLRRCLVAPL